MNLLLELLGNPHRGLKVIHIAGTNGKGSTAAMLASVLQAQGYRTGLYTSPYILRFNERMRVDGEPIADDALVELVVKVKRAIERMPTHMAPTEFEVITAAAFLYFQSQQCDYVVLEAGVGGRLDSTNVVENPICCVLTAVGYDHMKYLGSTLQEIAQDKCGIIKPHSKLVTYPKQEPCVMEVIGERCKQQNAELVVAPLPEHVHVSTRGSRFDCGIWKDIKLSLCGTYQPFNAATALACIQVLQSCGVKIGPESVRRGLEKTSWTGRFEIVSENPLTVLDGAHNISGMEEFKAALLQLAQGRKITLLVGMLRDKQYRECMDLISPAAERIVTTTVSSPRSVQACELAACLKDRNVVACPSPAQALAEAERLTAENEILAVCGSLYLVGELRPLFIPNPNK